jgi:alanine-synthesizing transaminase
MNPTFSDIVKGYESNLNPLYQARASRRSKGLRVVDLVSGNPTLANLRYPEAILEYALRKGVRQAQKYQPHPLGQPIARRTIQTFYQSQGLSIPVEHILITPGTSQSYWYLFKILANPGDEILCPRPSYPLLDMIADLCHVRLVPYRLLERKRWEIDLNHLESRISAKTRAIVFISPHNPTGTVASEAEINGLTEISVRHHLPIIADEVFSTFLFTGERYRRPCHRSLPLVFFLNGLSKMFALPGLKIGWIASHGNSTLVKKAARSLDLISDTFLPVNEAAQFALPILFRRGASFLERYQHELQLRQTLALQLLQKMPGVGFNPPEGGFYLTLRLQGKQDEEHRALELLKDTGILVHPGYFYDMEGSHLIFSFVATETILQTSLNKITTYFKREHLAG